MKATKPLSLDSVDFDNEEELRALTAQVLEAGNKIYAAQREESIRLGIIDEKGNLLRNGTDLDLNTT